MKIWYKHFMNYEDKKKFLPKDATFDDHKKSMDGYDSSKGYGSKEDYFRVHFYNEHPRLRRYHAYLKVHLKKDDEILSVGSGRCVNELLLAEEGFNIMCSDLEQPCKEETMRLFPCVQFMKYDVTKGPTARKFNCIFSLSMFYLFDEKQLLNVFENIANSLEPGGNFIFDPGGAKNNIITRLIDDFICPVETWLIKILQKVIKKKDCVVTKKHQGYRATNKEIISIANRAGFSLCDIKTDDYFTEFGMRSILFSRLPKGLVGLLGRSVPYVRMFCFKKKRKI